METMAMDQSMTAVPVGRRRVLAFGVAVLTLGLAGPAAAQRDLEGVTLRVATWGGGWAKNIETTIQPQLEARGAKVEYVIGNPHENLAKLIAARGQKPPFDVMELSEHNRRDIDEAGVLTALDYSKIANAAGIDLRYRLPTMVANSATIDGIAYNAQKFQELGLAPPRTYADLADPRLKGRVSFADATIIQGVKGIVAIAYENGGSEDNLQPGLDAVRRLDVGSYYNASTKLFTQFKSGDVWAAHWHVGWVIRARQAGMPLAMTFPEIKGQRGVTSNVWLGIIKGAGNDKAAHAFINEYLGPKAQEAMGRETGSRPVSQAAADALAKDPLMAEFLPLSADAFARVYYSDLSKIDTGALLDAWNRSVVRRAR
ncbi:MAG: extracellular solute-binding protein [Alphaproteobacteria bacterium]|nr:extracellular solute-binding protein [Alphaproteobacteria bacterium]